MEPTQNNETPPEPENKEEYRSWFLQHRSQDMVHVAPVEHNSNIDPNIAHILGLIKVNQEIRDRIQPFAKGFWGSKTVFRRLKFSHRVYVTSDLSNREDVAVCRIYPSKTEEKACNTRSMFSLGDKFSKYSVDKRGPITDGILRPINFTDCLHKSFQMKDEVLALFLVDLKEHLVIIQEDLGKIERWLIRPSYRFHQLKLFGDKIECLQFDHIFKALDFESKCVPCKCNYKRHSYSDKCLLDRCKQSFAKHMLKTTYALKCPKHRPNAGVFHCNQPVAFELCKFRSKLKIEGNHSISFNIDDEDELGHLINYVKAIREVELV
jgi:hypothetical protein